MSNTKLSLKQGEISTISSSWLLKQVRNKPNLFHRQETDSNLRNLVLFRLTRLAANHKSHYFWNKHQSNLRVRTAVAPLNRWFLCKSRQRLIKSNYCLPEKVIKFKALVILHRAEGIASVPQRVNSVRVLLQIWAKLSQKSTELISVTH
jgi:hypothetical protein